MTPNRNFRVRALGEIAIRCKDFPAMVRFYEDVIGLTPLEGGHRDGIVFFGLSESHGGHTAVLALFDGRGSQPGTGARSSLHHLALTIPATEQAGVIDWFESQGIPYRTETFGWIGWQGIFTEDPDGNTVELVAYDPSFRDRSAPRGAPPADDDPENWPV